MYNLTITTLQNKLTNKIYIQYCLNPRRQVSNFITTNEISKYAESDNDRAPWYERSIVKQDDKKLSPIKLA